MVTSSTVQYGIFHGIFSIFAYPVNFVLSALSSNALHVMRATDSREYAQYLGMAALLAIERRRFRDGRYSLFSEAPRAPIDVTQLDAALRAEYVKVYDELEALKGANRASDDATAAGEVVASGGAGPSTAIVVAEAGVSTDEAAVRALRRQLSAAERERDDALSRAAASERAREEVASRLESIERSRDEALSRVTVVAQARDDALARVAEATKIRAEALASQRKAERALQDARVHDEALVRKAGEDAARLDHLRHEVRVLQERTAAHQGEVDGNRAMITALQTKCEAANAAQETAERALAAANASLADERKRDEGRVAAVRREYQAREKETVRQIQNTIERTHRLGATLSDIIDSVQRSPAVSDGVVASNGETQSVSGLQEEAMQDETASGATSTARGVGVGRGGARPTTRSRAAGATSAPPSIPPLRLGVQGGRVVRVLNPERRRGHQADTASRRARARNAVGSTSSRRTRRDDDAHANP